MWHATCTQVNQGDFWLLVVGSQIGTLTPDPSFGHNLCFKYPNGSCEPILDIYILRTFQWYNEIFNPMSFDPFIVVWRFGSPLGLQFPKWEFNWECERFIPSQSPTLPRAWNVTLGLQFWPALQALVWEPKARVVTHISNSQNVRWWIPSKTMFLISTI
jgi:hypothetical protein